MTTPHVLFLLGSARRDGNAEQLARLAAQGLPAGATQTWLHLRDYPLPPFEDLRHMGGNTVGQSYAPAEGHALALLEATLQATDIVFVTPMYWYTMSTDLKRYLDEWSAWLRSAPDFKAQMATKRFWAVVSSTSGPEEAKPLFGTLALCAGFFGASLVGTLLGNGSKPGQALEAQETLQAAQQLFAPLR